MGKAAGGPDQSHSGARRRAGAGAPRPARTTGGFRRRAVVLRCAGAGAHCDRASGGRCEPLRGVERRRFLGWGFRARRLARVAPSPVRGAQGRRAQHPHSAVGAIRRARHDGDARGARGRGWSGHRPPGPAAAARAR
ncbi:hypothetical protein ACFPRL_18720 [Pseudoclavibacter helvolus]